VEVAEQVFEMPVRVGNPTGFGGLADSVKSPIWATGVGLIHYGNKNFGNLMVEKKEGELFKNIVDKFRQIFRDYF